MKRPKLVIALGFVAVLVSAIGAILADVLWIPARHPVPKDLVETAKVRGYGAIRFWGDENTKSFDDAMTAQYTQVREAAKAGTMPGALTQANFLSISGGGDKGAFAAGLLQGWTESGKRPVFESVTGVSTGAMAAPFAFLGTAYDHVLKEIYTTTNADQLYDNRWYIGILGNAVKGTAPLKSLIEHYVTDAVLDEIAAQSRIGRRLLVSTTDIDAQRPMIWDLTGIAASGRPDRRKLFVDVLLASAAVPGIFPPVRITVVADDGKTYDELHVDGGATAQMIFTPPEVKLYQFEDKVFSMRRHRTLYVIRNGKLAPEYDPAPENAIVLMGLGVETLVKYQVISNMQLLAIEAKTGRTEFRFDAIPNTVEVGAHKQFSRVFAEELFKIGHDLGRQENWSTSVPDTPELSQTSPAQGSSSSTRARADK